MKKVFLGLAGLAALLVVAVLVAPSFIDWTSYRNGIAAEVERALGRRVVIDGRVEASIVPSPRLSLGGVTLGNLVGATVPDMVQAEALELRLALWPLLSGRIVVTSVVLRKPVLELEVLPDGQRNWDFGLSIDDVRFENAVVNEGTIIYREADTGVEKRVEDVNARFAADGLHGPLRAAGELRYGNLPLRFTVSTGRFDLEGQAPTPLNLSVDISGPSRGLGRSPLVRGAGSFVGTIRLADHGQQIFGQIKLHGADLTSLVEAFDTGVDVPGVFAQAFTLDGTLDLKDNILNADGLTLQIGETRAQGAVNAALEGDQPRIDMALTLGRVDLDAWLAAAAKKDAARAAEQPAAAHGKDEFELPANLHLTLDLTADAVTRRSAGTGAGARQLKLAAEMADGVIDIHRFSAQLPGGTDAIFNGKLLAAEGRARVNGFAEVASDDFRSLLGWLDLDASGLPAGRFNKVSATSHLALTAETLELGELDMRFDSTRVTGALVAVLRERPAFGLNLFVDQINVESYLPGIAAAGAEATVAEVASALPLTSLTEFDANVRLRVGELTFGPATAHGVDLDGTLKEGVLTMRKLAVADLAGGAISLSGTLDGFDDKLAMDVEFDVAAAEPAGLLRLAEVVLPVPDSALKPFAAEGKLSGGGAAYKIDAAIHAGVTGLAVAGDLTLSATATETFGFAFDLGLEYPSYIDLIRQVAPAFAPEREPQALTVSLNTHIESTDDGYNLSALNGRFGPLTLDGSVTLGFDGGLPQVTAQLDAGDMDTRYFLAAPAPRPAPSRDAAAERWSTQPIDLDFAHAVTGSFRISGKTVHHRQWTIDEPEIDVVIGDGGIELKQLTGQWRGGTLDVHGKLMPSGGSDAALALAYTVSLAGTEIGPSLFGAPIDLSGGRVNLEAEGTATGSSEAALIASMNGRGSFAVENTTLRGIDLTRLNNRAPFVESSGELVRLIQAAMSSGSTRVTNLIGDYTIIEGIVGIDDLRIKSMAGDVRALVAAELPAWRLDATVEVSLASVPQAPPFEMQLGGPLDAAKRDFNSDALQTYLLEQSVTRQPQRAVPLPRTTRQAPAQPAPPVVQRRAPAPAPTPSQSAPAPAVRTQDGARVLQVSPNAPATAAPAQPVPPPVPATSGARVLQISPNAVAPESAGASQPTPDQPALGMPPAGQPAPPPVPPDPESFARDILRGLGP